MSDEWASAARLHSLTVNRSSLRLRVSGLPRRSPQGEDGRENEVDFSNRNIGLQPGVTQG